MSLGGLHPASVPFRRGWQAKGQTGGPSWWGAGEERVVKARESWPPGLSSLEMPPFRGAWFGGASPNPYFLDTWQDGGICLFFGVFLSSHVWNISQVPGNWLVAYVIFTTGL